ncbi:MAG: hypothetical protein A3F40_01955 [Chlamydiae bacterium RIFCSPHIGHO2_12_FULL_27_8]|nr:MAG: hypothetical protein A3F40_01955 [Chlamydiae bacterium RIFCSPHIGHO2_12_FULL_27_8]
MTQVITSLSNPTIKQIVKIRKDKKFREDEKKVLVVGKKAIKDLNKNHVAILITTNKHKINSIKSNKVLLVSNKIMKKITNVENPEDIAAVIDMDNSKKIVKKEFVLILDNISDPGNLGTLLRSANAFGFDLVIISKSSCDPYNEKALRAAKTATFFIPIKIMTEEEILNFIAKNNLHSYIADIEGKNIKNEEFKKPLCIILSNESKGPSNSLKKISKKVTILMKKDVDSLNVAVAGSIIMHRIKDL